MLLCATLIGLLCIEGPRLPVEKTFSLWVNERVKFANSQLNHAVLDAHYSIASSSLGRACKLGTCVRYALRADGCIIKFNIYLDDDRKPYDGADEYDLTLNTASDISNSLSHIYIKKTVTDDGSGLALAEIQPFKDVKLDCTKP